MVDQLGNSIYDTVSLNDGTFVFPIVASGNYRLELANFVADVAPIAVTSSDVTGLEVIARPGGELHGVSKTGFASQKLAGVEHFCEKPSKQAVSHTKRLDWVREIGTTTQAGWDICEIGGSLEAGGYFVR